MLENPAPPKPLTRLDYLLAALVFALGLALYVRTLAPSVLLGDSGEFQVLAYTLGIAHNTGYPIYLLLGKLFTFLPFGDVAYRVNLLSAVCAALALAEVYLIGNLLTGKRFLSLAGPLMLAINAIFWWQAVIAEVYTPAAAFIGGVLLFIFLWNRTAQPRYLFIAGLLGGLSLGIHTLVALAAPAVLIYLVMKKANLPAWKAALLGGLVGFLLFALSFIALDAYGHPTGMPANFRVHASAYGFQPEDFDSPVIRISFIFFSRQWQVQMFSGTAEDVNNNIMAYLDSTWGTFGPAFFFLILIGALGLFSSGSGIDPRWKEGILLLGSWLGMLVFLANYRVGDLEVFFIPVFVILAVFLSVGASQVVAGMSAFLRALHLKKNLTLRLASLVLFGVCLWSIWPYLHSVQKSIDLGRIMFLDESRMYYPYPVMDPEYPLRTGRQLASKVEENAILFINWDMLYPACYAAVVEQHRQETACYEPMPFGTNNRIASSTIKFIRQNIDQRPIYFSLIPDDLKGLSKFKQVSFSYPLYKLEKR